MSVYIIALLKFADVEVFAKFNGTAVITDEVPRRLEGNWAVDKVVVLASHLKRTPWRFQESPEYQAISKTEKPGPTP